MFSFIYKMYIIGNEYVFLPWIIIFPGPWLCFVWLSSVHSQTRCTSGVTNLQLGPKPITSNEAWKIVHIRLIIKYKTNTSSFHGTDSPTKIIFILFPIFGDEDEYKDPVRTKVFISAIPFKLVKFGYQKIPI